MGFVWISKRDLDELLVQLCLYRKVEFFVFFLWVLKKKRGGTIISSFEGSWCSAAGEIAGDSHCSANFYHHHHHHYQSRFFSSYSYINGWGVWNDDFLLLPKKNDGFLLSFDHMNPCCIWLQICVNGAWAQLPLCSCKQTITSSFWCFFIPKDLTVPIWVFIKILEFPSNPRTSSSDDEKFVNSTPPGCG